MTTRDSTLLRVKLESALEALSPAARDVFYEIEREDAPAEEGGGADLELPEAFGDLTADERAALIGALQLSIDLRRLEEADEADNEGHSDSISRLRRRLYIVSALVSLAFLVVLGIVWARVNAAPLTSNPDDTVVSTPEAATRYLAAHVPASEDNSEQPTFIPTGMYIESVQFTGPYNVSVSGFVWQRYANDLPQDISKGFLLPEAEDASISEVYRVQQGDEELIGWSFQGTIREQFDYHKYPLDRQQIWIQLWHADFERNVYLTPDFGAYTSLDPAALPGLDQDFVLENWSIQRSFFSYRTNPYNSDFGFDSYVAEQSQPELYFNISAKRDVFSASISRAIVPIVILIQLFVLVAVIGTNRERLEQFGVRPGAVIFTGAAFFFAVLLAQNALRSEVQEAGLVYLESLYIITYLVILAVAINSVLLVAYPNIRLFRDNDNLWVEVLYWPLILLALILITFLTFR